MTSWLPFEVRWRDALLAAMIPPDPGGRLPGLAGLDLGAFWVLFGRAAPPLLRIGFRLSVWFLTFGPILLGFAPRLFHRLAPASRGPFLDAALHSGFLPARQTASVVKLVACLAYFESPAVRAAVGGGEGA